MKMLRWVILLQLKYVLRATRITVLLTLCKKSCYIVENLLLMYKLRKANIFRLFFSFDGYSHFSMISNYQMIRDYITNVSVVNWNKIVLWFIEQHNNKKDETKVHTKDAGMMVKIGHHQVKFISIVNCDFLYYVVC